MPTFYYTQTVTYTLQVQAASAEAADEIAALTDVNSAGVNATYEGWQEDGVETD